MAFKHSQRMIRTSIGLIITAAGLVIMVSEVLI